MRVIVTLTKTETFTIDEIESIEDAKEAALFLWDEDDDAPTILDITVDPQV